MKRETIFIMALMSLMGAIGMVGLLGAIFGNTIEKANVISIFSLVFGNAGILFSVLLFSKVNNGID